MSNPSVERMRETKCRRSWLKNPTQQKKKSVILKAFTKDIKSVYILDLRGKNRICQMMTLR